MWDPAPWPGIKPIPTALRGRSLSHWNTREVPGLIIFDLSNCHCPSFYDTFGHLLCEINSLWFHFSNILFSTATWYLRFHLLQVMEMTVSDEVWVVPIVPSVPVFPNMNLEIHFTPPSLSHSVLWVTRSTGGQIELYCFPSIYHCLWASLVAEMVKNPPVMQGTWVWSLGWEGPLEEGMVTHSSIISWRIHMDRGAWPATVMRLQRVRHI